MKRGVTIFILVTVVVLGFAVHSVWTLLGLLVASGRQDAILRGELPAPNSGTINQRPQLIPKIIHQTYKNESIPAHWQGPQQSCLDLHPDYEYKLWTDKKSREFIAAEYPWFLETFDGYPYPIQRADAIRYFVLHHFGGIYIDLDDGCNRSLDPLLAYPAWVRRTLPTGISNDAMGSVPRHPFFLKAIDSLTDYNRRWPLPYITVMASTGPLYLSIIWRHYNNASPEGANRVRILFPDEYNNHPWSFFTHHVGSSWHRTDVKVIFWLAKHWVFVTFLGFAAGFSLLGLLYKIFVLNKHPSSPRLSPKSRSFDRFAYTRIPFYRRISSKDMELEDRHEV
ncbi:nucleotide-diphospho-sugar transferase [Phaeosphaeria sp. MPI-PUGE-AT-0046c]|nr:nucleotide-diphospho-sugar transferase [Phaeosphaeria sp. MPI-PUGE-AT-0046c]